MHTFISVEWNILLGKDFITKRCRKIKVHILCQITFYSENCAVYDMITKDTAEPVRPKKLLITQT